MATHLGSFTNLPTLRGQIDPDTGKKYIYTPALPFWRDYEKEPVTAPEITMEKGRTIIETPKFGYTGSLKSLPKAREVVAKEAEVIPPPKKAEKKEVRALEKRTAIPDRTTFIKEFVLPRLGGVDPYVVNVPVKARQLYLKNRDKAFKQVFPNIPIGGMLTTEQQKHWQKVDERLRQHYYNWAKEENEFQKTLYGHMLAEYEKLKKEIEAKEELRFKETPEERRAAEERMQIRKEERAYKRKIEDEIRKELRESGKKKTLKRTDISVLTSAYLGLMKSIEEGNDEEIKLRVNSINKIRESLGLGPMKVKTIPGKKKVKILGIPIPFTGAPESKTYLMDYRKEPLPPGLTEEDIEFNKKKYGKSREEIIKKYKELKGIK